MENTDHPQDPAPAVALDPAVVQRIFRSQPFSVFLGAELIEAQPGFAEIAIDLRDNLRQQHGFAHGGVVSYLADNALTFAGGLALGGDALTSEFKINYVRPAGGVRLLASARTRATGKRQAVCQCDVFSIDEAGEKRLCALAQGTIVSLA